MMVLLLCNTHQEAQNLCKTLKSDHSFYNNVIFLSFWDCFSGLYGFKRNDTYGEKHQESLNNNKNTRIS